MSTSISVYFFTRLVFHAHLMKKKTKICENKLNKNECNFKK